MILMGPFQLRMCYDVLTLFQQKCLCFNDVMTARSQRKFLVLWKNCKFMSITVTKSRRIGEPMNVSSYYLST